MSELDDRNKKAARPKIIGLWLTIVVSFLVMGGSMTKWMNQYGNLIGFFLGIATGAVVLVIGLAIGYVAGRVSNASGK